VEVAATAPQVPSVAPLAMLQMPLQQSKAFEQTSPDWMQKDDPRTQAPSRQSWEQHWSLLEQALPAVMHATLSAWQVPPTQLPLQQAWLEVQAPWSEVQTAASQTPC